ncbi:MAG TPA: PhzF family phenazine biosynthesis protein, partial [Planctomycetaceae bacterium]
HARRRPRPLGVRSRPRRGVAPVLDPQRRPDLHPVRRLDRPRLSGDPTSPADPPQGLLDALGVRPRSVGRSKFDYLLVLDSEAAVRAARPDFRRLAEVPTRGVIVTAPSDDPSFDFVSRFFAPAVGVDEDPVTGSAHCCLTPYWSERLGKSELLARQVSARGGVLRLKNHGGRVVLGGRAVTVLRGELV